MSAQVHVHVRLSGPCAVVPPPTWLCRDVLLTIMTEGQEAPPRVLEGRTLTLPAVVLKAQVEPVGGGYRLRWVASPAMRVLDTFRLQVPTLQAGGLDDVATVARTVVVVRLNQPVPPLTEALLWREDNSLWTLRAVEHRLATARRFAEAEPAPPGAKDIVALFVEGEASLAVGDVVEFIQPRRTK